MKKILAIDDQKDNLTIYEAVIKSRLGNHKLLTALSGKEGIKIAKEQQPDAILLDIIMPDMDGYETCKMLKEDELTKHIPIIMITALETDAASRTKGLDMGADAFLSKPIDAVEFTAQLNVVLRIKEAEDKLRDENYYLKTLSEEQIKKIIKSEDNYRTIFEDAYDGIIHVDKNLTVLNVNKAFTEITGISKEYVIGKSAFSLAKKFVNIKQLPQILGIVKNMLSNRKVIPYELNYKNKILEIVPVKQKSGYQTVVIRDITDRKLAEEALKESEEKFRMMILNSPNLTIIQNPDGEVVYVSPQAKELLGHTEDVFLNTKFPEFIHPDDKEMAFEMMKKSLKGEDIHNFEYRIFGDKGELNWLSHSARAIKTNGKVTSIQSYVVNINKYKYAEEKLLKNRHYLAKAQEIGNIGTWELDVNKNILRWTDENYKIFGIPLGTDLNYETFLNCVHPDDKEFVNKKWTEALINGDYDIEHRLIVDGKIKWVREKADIEFDSNGKAIKAIGVTQDITRSKLIEKELENSRNQYHQLFDLLPYGGEVINKKGIIVNCSTSTALMLGYEEDEIIGQHISKFLSPESVEIFKEKFPVLISGKPMSTDITMICKDGTELQILRAAQPIFGDNGKVNSVLVLNVDVTDRRKAEEVLKESEERLKIIFEFAPDAYYLSNLKGEFLDGNAAAEEILGFKKKELIGKSFLNLKLLSANDFLKAAKALAKSVMGKKTGPDEFLLKRKDGSKLSVEISTFPVKIKNKDVILGIARDITERKRTEFALKESEEKYRNLVERANDGICIIQDGVIKFANPSLVDLYGGKLSKVIGSPFADFIHPDELNKISKYYELRLKGENVPSIYETIFRHNKGHKVYVEISAGIINYLGKPADLVIVRDITERRETEKSLLKLSIAVDQSPSVIVITGLDGRIEYVNPKFTETTGYSKNEAIGKLTSILKSGTQSDEVYQKLWQTISSGNIWHGEFHNKKKNGELFWEAASVSPIIDKTGKVTNYIKVAEDISERKLAEDDLRKALEKAEESDRLKSAFLANMSHEIRTPMNGILGFASLLKTPNLSGEKLKKYINVIDNSGKRMLNIINDLIDISKIEAGQMDTYISECNINEQIEYLNTFFKPEAIKVNLDLSYNNPLPTKDTFVKTDREKLYAILTNLLKNAIKYTHEGSIKFGYERKGEMLEFYVKDTGIGIPEDRQEAIFERFIQADIEDRKAYEGAGLGLSITKAYVEMLGGKIWVESVEGQGSQFYFTIPYNVDKRLEIKTEVEKEKSLPATSRKLKILIAEDEEVVMEYLKIILRESSKEILHTKSGKEVIKLCRSNPDLDLVLMDIKMPGMDGYEATREIRKFNKNVVIIAQTAYALSGDREKALAAGCDDYVSKPVNQNKLLKVIGKCLNKK